MTSSLFSRLEKFVETAVVRLFELQFPDHQEPNDAQLKELLSWFHDYFWAVGQVCSHPDGGMTEDQARLLFRLKSIFPVEARTNPQEILHAARSRSPGEWERLSELALKEPEVLSMLATQFTELRQSCQSLILEFANLVRGAKQGATSATVDVIARIRSANAASSAGARPTALETVTPPSLSELCKLIGLEPVKNEIERLVDLVNISRMRRANGLPELETSNHLVFYGNPGTGKTTVARLIGKLYTELGLLTSGHIVEVSRSGLVAGYLGQTAIKVEEAVNRARNGVLFIDEAYALKQRDDDMYGQEAIDTLLKLMEDHRHSLVVVVAGYTQQMKAFLTTNPGLESRFNRYLDFPDYRPEELLSIFEDMLRSKGLSLTEDARADAMTIFTSAFNCKQSSSGNGRFVRNVFDKTLGRQAHRLSQATIVDQKALTVIQLDDLPLSWATGISSGEGLVLNS